MPTDNSVDKIPPPPGATPPAQYPGNTPCLYGSHVGPSGDTVCNDAPGGSGHPADDRISEDQWSAWTSFKDPSCPPDKPYKSERGSPGCFEKPVDCPEGQIPSGPGTAPCRPLRPGELEGPGGGGGGKGGGGGASGPGGALQNSAMSLLGIGAPTSGLINDQLTKIIGGATRFSPEVMADITGAQKLQQQGDVASQTGALRENQAARGTLFSPSGAEQERLVQEGAASRFDAGQRELRIQKATTDFTDKMSALSAAQTWLNGLRQYALGLDANDVQRQKISADLELGYAQIKSQMELLLTKISGDKDVVGMQLESNEYLNMQKFIICVTTGSC